ncbi:MAG: hypothetical protein EXQ52_11840 [Bryobacterales bacterium]|nr:hypothetical protein [Bryobacterales bacterium]
MPKIMFEPWQLDTGPVEGDLEYVLGSRHALANAIQILAGGIAVVSTVRRYFLIGGNKSCRSQK